MKSKIALVIISSMLFLGCSTIKKAKLESSEPKVVIKNIESLKKTLIETNADLLGKENFTAGDKKLNKAKKDFNNSEPTDEILSTLAESKFYFLSAKDAANMRKIKPKNILTARQNAIKTNIYTHPLLTQKLNDIDDSLINNSYNFRQVLSTEELSNFQQRYQRLEIESIQNLRLGLFKKMIRKAEKENAEKLAPQTLMSAKNATNNADNLISQSVLDPSQYMMSVKEANKSVKLLNDVMDKLTNEAKGSSEGTALKLVYQERKLGNLSDKVNFLQSSLTRSSNQMGAMGEDIKDKNTQLASSKRKINFQMAMNQVSDTFNENEADVYQQGENLIIRLKKINFKSGSADIPSNSMSLLAKVNSIITKLHPTDVIIQGHTDSSGKAANNMMLSNKRALAVKDYLYSLNPKYPIDARGYGESKPIANNQTRTGRILNRRVDIVVKGSKQ